MIGVMNVIPGLYGSEFFQMLLTDQDVVNLFFRIVIGVSVWSGRVCKSKNLPQLRNFFLPWFGVQVAGKDDRKVSAHEVHGFFGLSQAGRLVECEMDGCKSYLFRSEEHTSELQS